MVEHGTTGLRLALIYRQQSVTCDTEHVNIGQRDVGDMRQVNTSSVAAAILYITVFVMAVN